MQKLNETKEIETWITVDEDEKNINEQWLKKRKKERRENNER